ncbi:MAG: hypothetical protein ACQET5_01330 [Halobacteriota archaeon]|uniref:hypothetical protein n=1 Tax=Natronomonas sp. TaxID=2184060 RepID=UPI003977215A
MNNKRVRRAVLLYLTGQLTEAEAAKRAEIPRSRLRHYARTSGAIAPSPIEPTDGSHAT